MGKLINKLVDIFSQAAIDPAVESNWAVSIERFLNLGGPMDEIWAVVWHQSR